MGLQHGLPQGHVVYEPLYLGLHPPVPELHLAELVGAHDAAAGGSRLGGGEAADVGPVLVDPVVVEGTAAWKTTKEITQC